jgi:hypothetical protein
VFGKITLVRVWCAWRFSFSSPYIKSVLSSRIDTHSLSKKNTCTTKAAQDYYHRKLDIGSCLVYYLFFFIEKCLHHQSSARLLSSEAGYWFVFGILIRVWCTWRFILSYRYSFFMREKCLHHQSSTRLLSSEAGILVRVWCAWRFLFSAA